MELIQSKMEKIKYIKVDNELVIGAYNYNLDNYPSAYIYTDRPLYKNTDTINIWGFVPRTLFFDKIDEEFYIELNGEGKRKIEVGKDGNFQTTIELKNNVSVLRDEILGLKGDIREMRAEQKGEVNAITTRMNGIEKRIDDLQGNQTKWFTVLGILIAAVPVAIALIQGLIVK